MPRLGFSIALLLALAVPSAQARRFSSSLDLKVYENGSDGKPDRYLGATSSKVSRTISVPGSNRWYIRPTGRLDENTLIDLATEMRQKRVPGLDLSNRWDVQNQSLAPFENMPTLRFLVLAETRTTDASLDHVETLSGLRFLAMGAQTTDKALARLSSQKELVALSLAGSKITNRGLPALKALPLLQTLDISGTRINDAGAKILSELPALLQLDISGTAITDKGLATLKKLNHLQILCLGSRVTNAGLRHIPAFKELRILDIRESKITERGIATLAGARNLEELSLAWTQMTPARIRALGRLPQLKRVILNGQEMPSEVLQKIRSLTKLASSSRSSRKPS